MLGMIAMQALHVAALKGCPAAVQVLLDAGVPAASRSSRGWTALDEALAAKALPTARLLQQKLLADAKTELKQKRAQLLESMKAMPDYSLQVSDNDAANISSSLP
jgi:ankyrin repeat protein